MNVHSNVQTVPVDHLFLFVLPLLLVLLLFPFAQMVPANPPINVPFRTHVPPKHQNSAQMASVFQLTIVVLPSFVLPRHHLSVLTDFAPPHL